MTTVSLALLGVWFVISVLAQLPIGPVKALKSHDVFSLMPRWSFFAPRPGTFDYHLLYRDHCSAGEQTPWKEVTLSDTRTIKGAIWNPEKRCKKALSDTVRSLTQLLRNGRPKSLSLSIPYLGILNYVTGLQHAPQASATEFMILRTEGFMADCQPRLMFHSDLHKLS